MTMEEVVDHRGDELPPLTKRSKNVNLDRILKFHRTDFSPKPLATPGLWPIFSQMTKYGEQHTLRRTWYHYHETDPNDGPGVLAVSWHTAGLVDPALIIHQIKKDYVFAGRQDILTGPIIGWWGRRMGVQPLLRQAERKRGYVDDETATRVNSSSMLTVASKLAHGHGSVLMPEGHSHSEWHILRLRTGSIRSALNAAAIARELGNDPPVILPIGLTFREPQSWYSEVLVEFSKPIEMPKLPDVDHGKRLLDGEWIEPDKETTLKVRSELRDRLGCLVPDAPDIDTWRAWRLLAHIQSDTSLSWKDEVLNARAIRDSMRGSNDKVLQGPESCGEVDRASSSDLTDLARKTSHKLHKMKLDGRAIHKEESNFLFMVLFAIYFSPFALFTGLIALLGTGLSSLIGLIISRFNSEAEDKRTTFHLMSTMLGTIYVRPIIHIVTAALLFHYGYINDIIFTVVCIPIIWFITDLSTMFCRDFYLGLLVDLSRRFRTFLAHQSNDWADISIDVKELNKMLDAIK
ncbi:MAG: hypothetical protein CMO20_02290 [Thermoplasmata archaeon]|nr:hypothetical protein [Thermoplasmata archaeon]